MSYEDELMKARAEKRQMMMMLFGLVATIGIIGMSNLVNTLTANLLVRTGEFGTLRAVGMNMSELSHLVRLEGLFYGAISSLWGAVLGTVMSGMLFLSMRGHMTYLSWSLPWQPVVLASVCTALLTTVSTCPALGRIAKLDIVEAIRRVE